MSDQVSVEPGPCWADSGVSWPSMPEGTTVRCELRVGHAGAHEADRREMGGTAVWPNEPTHSVPGAWVVYDYDHGPYAISLHSAVAEAARSAAIQGYGRVGFWPFGTEFADAVNEWEGRS